MATEYESTALSHKEKRLLKKLARQAKAEELAEKEAEAPELKQVDLAVLDDSADEEDDDDEYEGSKPVDDDDDGDEEEEVADDDDEEEVSYSDVEIDDDADVVPHQKLTINNKAAIMQALGRVKIDWEKYPFDEGQAILYHTKVEPELKDIYDDTERELAFFKQGLDAAQEGRTKLLALKVPFSRPADYFAEMVKSDEHMEKLKMKLTQEATEKKAKEEAKRQRQLKKFGKKVQHETLQQRQKEKRETLDKIKSLKKKRRNNEIGDSEFDVGVEDAAKEPEFGGVSKKKRHIQSEVSSKKKFQKKNRPGRNRRRKRM